MTSLVNLVIVIIVLVIIFDDKKNDTLLEYEQRQALAKQYAGGCKSFDELTEKKRKQYLSYQTKGEFCMKSFFKDHPIGTLAQFLSPQNLKQYENHLKTEHCKQVEQILWQAYTQLYPKAPPVDFNDDFSSLQGNWDYQILLETAPGTFFCKIKKQYIDNNNLILKHRLQTNPVKNLKSLSQHPWLNEPEAKRRKAINNLLALINKDFTKAQSYLVKIAHEDQVITLSPEQYFLLLERLNKKNKLPLKWQPLLTQVKAKISSEKHYHLMEAAHYPIFNFPN